MSEPARKVASYADLLAAPEHHIAQIVHGVLHTQPRPAPRHARASSMLGGELQGPFDRGRGGPGGWWLLDEPECHLDGHVLVPDLAGWRRERMPALPDTAWFDVVPDWVCEVLSPGSARLDRIDKMPLYGELGVGHLWLLDPERRTLEAYARHDGRWLLLGADADDARVRLEPFEALELELGVLWA